MTERSVADRALPSADLVAHAGVCLAAAVVGMEALRGGYTPQPLCRLLLADGRSVVLKAATSPSDPSELAWAEVLRGEILAYRQLTMLAPWQPRMLGDFTLAGSVVLLLEDLSAAQRVPPWTSGVVDTVAHSLAQMHARTTGSSPPLGIPWVATPPPHFVSVQERGQILGDLPPCWGSQAGRAWLQVACWTGITAMGDGWHAGPHCVIHGDVRSDNTFIREGRIVLIDWALAKWASPAREVILWALGVEAEGGGVAPFVYGRYLQQAPAIPAAATRANLVRFAGYCLDRLQSGESPRNLLSFYLAMLGPTLRWYAWELGLPLPPCP